MRIRMRMMMKPYLKNRLAYNGSTLRNDGLNRRKKRFALMYTSEIVFF